MGKPRANGPVQVSDHAVVRYLERVGGFDIEGLKAGIADRLGDAAAAQASAVVIDGFVFCLSRGKEGPVVTTVLGKNEGHLLHIKPEDRHK